ncbi:MAG: M18 family aminopeptidase [Bacilli bacterium]
MNDNEKMIELLNSSYSQFHVVENMSQMLKSEGYLELDEKTDFSLSWGKNYFVTRNGSSLIAFSLPKKNSEAGFRITASHTDSPTFKVKPNPLKKRNNLLMLNTEPYGGGIYSTWMDKPLSIAGRVMVMDNGEVHNHLFNVDRDLLIIPSVCIHMNRNANNQASFNPSCDTIPLFSSDCNLDFSSFLLEELGYTSPVMSQVLSYDLFLYNRQKAARIGAYGEFLGSSREDDLTSAYSALFGFMASSHNKDISLFASFDNEEVGSLTRQGANSTFLKDIMKRIAASLKLEFEKAVASSILISIDNAHANHPNHPEYSDSTTEVVLDGGVVIKYNANQSYTSDGFSSALVKSLLIKNGQPYQEYTNRSDLRGGSTLGNISNSEVSLISCDIGIAQLAMHSSYEVLALADIQRMTDFVREFYSTDITLSGNTFSI